ncbi:MAG: hypothetical protein JWN19_2881 [Arthrobacter sp.]|nr:hypothetical protein [Arthrobacter sp.]
MRRTIATIGILGITLLGSAATAHAAPPSAAAEVPSASATVDSTDNVAAPGGDSTAAEKQAKPDRGDKPTSGHWPGRGDEDKGHWPGKGDEDKGGHWPDKGDKDDCEKPEKPPVEKPEKPPVEQPVTPPVEQPVAPAPVNVGFNVQTAAAGNVSAAVPLWLSVLTGLLTAGVATVLLRVMARGRHAAS